MQNLEKNNIYNSNEELNKYLLNVKIIDKYNMIETKLNVMEMLDEYVRLQYKYLEIVPPRVTFNYEIKSDYESNLDADKLVYYINKKFETEKEIRKFYIEFQKVLSNMTKSEIVVFNFLLLKGDSEESVCEKLGLSRTGLRPIKFSCILKLAFAFNLEKLK